VVARRSGLGKGLTALIPPEAGGTDPEDGLRQVAVADIRPNARQPRTYFDEEAMASLAGSIQAVGVLQPVLVRPIDEEPGQYELIAGERRWRAARRAGLQTMPVLVQTETTDAHSLEQALVENLHREDLNPLEEAGAYQQLIDEFGFTHDQVAARVGKGRTTVTNTLRLLQLPAGAQRALADGSISAGHARALLGTPDRSLQEIMVRRIMTEGLTVRAVEDMLRGDEDPGAAESAASPTDAGTTASATAPAPVRKLPEPGVLELEELLAEHLDTRVKVEMRNRRGRVVVEFATIEDLERIYRAMLGERSKAAAGAGEPAVADTEPASPA
jgi:ParB family chromosome partitioning protein